ncbi:hypothetical protein NC651_036963 [Populus alba x Populus x berolinensis]|nr:hypothetical protein NC651_036963 [Populus alba x Populus x berolinensis]
MPDNSATKTNIVADLLRKKHWISVEMKFVVQGTSSSAKDDYWEDRNITLYGTYLEADFACNIASVYVNCDLDNPITSTSILLKSAFMSPSVLTADFNETLQPVFYRKIYGNICTPEHHRFKVVEKLSSPRIKLRKWNATTFGNLERN